MFPFLLVCQICWHIIVHTIFLWYFCTSLVSVEMSPFLFYLGSLPFLLGEPGQRFSNFVLPLQRTSSCFHWFFYIVFKFLTVSILSLIFFISFLLLTGFWLFFFWFFMRKVRLLICIFCVSWGRPISSWTFLLERFCCIPYILLGLLLFVSRYFLIFSLIFSSIHLFLVTCCLVSLWYSVFSYLLSKFFHRHIH